VDTLEKSIRIPFALLVNSQYDADLLFYSYVLMQRTVRVRDFFLSQKQELHHFNLFMQRFHLNDAIMRERIMYETRFWLFILAVHADSEK